MKKEYENFYVEEDKEHKYLDKAVVEQGYNSWWRMDYKSESTGNISGDAGHGGYVDVSIKKDAGCGFAGDLYMTIKGKTYHFEIDDIEEINFRAEGGCEVTDIKNISESIVKTIKTGYNYNE